jgi:hypothetical protein
MGLTDASGQGATTYGNFPGFNFSETGSGSVARYNFSNGMFVGSERSMGFGMSGIAMGGAFGNLRYEGTQFGYNFQNAPVTVFGSVGSLKYDSGLGMNLSLSFGAGFSQQGSGLVDSDIHSDLPPGASPLAFGHR